MELIYKSQVIGSAALDEYGGFDGGIIEYESDGGDVENFRVRVFKSSDFSTWEEAVRGGRYFPPAAIYSDIIIPVETTDSAGGSILTLIEALWMVGDFKNGIERNDIRIIRNAAEGAPTGLPAIEGTTDLRHVIGSSVEIDGIIYKISDEIEVSDYYEEIAAVNSWFNTGWTTTGEYRVFNIPANQPFIVLSVGNVGDNTRPPGILRDVYWSGIGNSSEHYTFIHTGSRIRYDWKLQVSGMTPHLYTLTQVPDQHIGDFSFKVSDFDKSRINFVFEDQIDIGWVDLVYGNELVDLRESPISLLRVDAPIIPGQSAEIELPAALQVNDGGSIFVKANHIVKAGTDINGPEILSVNPARATISGAATYRVSGLATDRNRGGNGVASVYVNDIRVNGAQSEDDTDAIWVMDVEITQGLNEISVRAEDTVGNRTDITISVEFDSSQPVVVKEYEDFISPTIDSRMIWVPPGAFKMGSQQSGFGLFNAEIPQHQVILTRGFWLGETEVTQKQWSAVMGSNPSRFRGSSILPVETISMDQCMEFCRTLTRIEHYAGRIPENMHYSLPTESQWEYASRAGNQPPESSVWHLYNSEFQYIGGVYTRMNDFTGFNRHLSHKWAGTQEVAVGTANFWGFYDMPGNVGEWCLDRYGKYTSQSKINPTGPSVGDSHVIRGGSWATEPNFCRVTSRSPASPGYRGYDVGFRLALQFDDSNGNTGPLIQLSNPINGTAVKMSSIYLEGIAFNVGDGVSSVRVNKVPVKFAEPTDDGGISWGIVVDLVEGDNEILIEATDRMGKTSQISITIEYIYSGPVIQLIKPVNGAIVSMPSILVTGTAIDMEEGIRSVEVNKVPVEGAEPGTNGGLNWGIVVDLVEGENEIVIEATDEAGNISQFTSTIEYIPSEPLMPVAGSGYRSEFIDAELIWVEPGTFIMGSPESEVGSDGDETQHTVTLTKGYWLGQTEVTKAQWASVMGHHWSSLWEDSGHFPVVRVSWSECQEFCRRLTDMDRKDGRLPDTMSYTLPTEAQWEYACRAGTSGMSWLGDFEIHGDFHAPELEQIAWFAGNSSYKAQSVAGKPANPWGFHDMLGNVMEWCSDWHGDYSTGSVTDPTGPSSGSKKVLRGGTYDSYPGYCRSASRFSENPALNFGTFGFRLALQISE